MLRRKQTNGIESGHTLQAALFQTGPGGVGSLRTQGSGGSFLGGGISKCHASDDDKRLVCTRQSKMFVQLRGGRGAESRGTCIMNHLILNLDFIHNVNESIRRVQEAGIYYNERPIRRRQIQENISRRMSVHQSIFVSTTLTHRSF